MSELLNLDHRKKKVKKKKAEVIKMG